MGTGAGTETREAASSGDENGDRNGVWSRGGSGNKNRERRAGGGELWYPLNQETRRVENQTLPFHTRHHLYRHEVAPAGSQ